MSATLLSVVVPAFNEDAVIDHFHQRLTTALATIDSIACELLYIDDGSRDGTFAKLQAIAESDARVRVLRLSRNFGHQIAITCGIDHAIGDAVVIIDADLQDPPEVIPSMVSAWRAGADVAYGQRKTRAGESAFKRWTATAFYRFLNALSDVEVPMDTGDFRLMSRRAVDALRQLREESRYMRGLVAWVGFTQVAVPYDRDARAAGSTHYSLRQMISLAKNGVAGFSDRPLRLATNLGGVTSMVAFLLGIYVVLSKVLHPEQSTPGFAALAVLVLFLGGLQLLSIGLVGEYLGRVFRESKQRPLYFVMDDIGAAERREH